MTLDLYEDEVDIFFDIAVDLILAEDRVSASLLQRRLMIGYARAARLLDQLEESGIIGSADGANPRQILIDKYNYVRPKFKVKVKSNEPVIGNLKWKKIDSKKIDNHVLAKYLEKKDSFKILLGQNDKGKAVNLDLEKYGNLMISGCQFTDANKLVNQILVSTVSKYSGKDVRLILADGYTDELIFPSESPHLLTPMIVDLDKVVSSLKWVVAEIDRRRKMAREGIKEKLHKILVVLTGLDDMYCFSPAEVEDCIYRILRLGKKYGVYIIMNVDWIDYSKYKQIMVLITSKAIFKPSDSRLVDKDTKKDALTLNKTNEAILWRVFEDNLKFEVLNLDIKRIYGEIFE